MTGEPDPRPASDELQFDHVVDADGTAGAGSANASRVCARCHSPIRLYYYQIDGHLTCSACKQAIERDLARTGATGRTAAPMLRAALFGLGAAVAGAIVYYAVIAITGWQIGYVAILIGYMVGYAVMKGSRGRGGRRFQFLAVGLTYVAIGLAYAPMSFKELSKDRGAKAAAAAVDSIAPSTIAPNDDTRGASTTAAPGRANAKPLGTGGLLFGVGALVLLVFALPLIVVFGSLPLGLISGIIIGVGLRQAWRMTAAATMPIVGPFKVGVTSAPEA